MRGDALMMVDGPRHASGRTTLNFGARGVMAAVITVYGANRDLHSGNYGNWAPNPALALARLLASMKDERGRVTIAGFYDDVVPLTAAERRAIEEIPDVEPSLMRAFGFSRQENASQRLELWHNQPALNVNGLESGTVGGQGARSFPRTRARASTCVLSRRSIRHGSSSGSWRTCARKGSSWPMPSPTRRCARRIRGSRA